MPFNLGGGELVFLLIIIAPFSVIPAIITWRRGGSGPRIAGTFFVGLVPYLGWVLSWVIALKTKREKKCPQCAEGVRIEALVCWHCQYRFATVPTGPTA